MAQIPDIFEQIDEEMEADKFREYWEKNRAFIIGVLVLFFLGLFGFVGWQNYQEKQAREASNLFLGAQETEAKSGPEAAEKSLEELIQAFGSHGYGVLSRLKRAELLAKEGKTDRALIDLEAVGGDSGAPDILRNMAWMNAAWLASGDPAKSRGYLAKIDKNSPFQASALELEGLFLQKEGKQQQALASFEKGAGLKPQGPLMERLQRRIERLKAVNG